MAAGKTPVVESKVFAPDVVMSAVTGTILSHGWAEVHEFLEWVAGVPVMTHTLASDDVFQHLRTLVYGQFPMLAKLPTVEGVTDEATAAAWVRTRTTELLLPAAYTVTRVRWVEVTDE